MKQFIILCFSALLLNACDYLDQKPLEYWQPEDVFVDGDRAGQVLHAAYNFMPAGFNSLGAFLAVATDDAAHVNWSNSVYKISHGFVTEMNPVDNYWYNGYIGVRRTLYFEEYIHLLQNWPGETEAQVEARKKIWIGESKALRALFYFELIKRYGGVPLIERTYTLNDPEIASIPRSSFEKCVDYIVELCDAAADSLAVTPYGSNFGRMTKGAALAIKAKTLAYAASPLFNDTNDPVLGYTGGDTKSRWEEAARALKAVIDLKDGAGAPVYSLFNDYEKLFIAAPNTNKEYIVSTGNPKSHSLESLLYPPSLLGSGTNCPSQNLVEAFEKVDGSPVDMTAPDRYEGLDPRFYATVLYDGATLGARGTIRISDPNSQDAIEKIINRSTVTGYYLRKFLDPSIDLSATTPGNTFHIFPVIRLADIYLLYAEAMNEAYGPNQANGMELTATDALNKVRQRVGMPDYTPASVADMREKIRNERRVELAFEDQRYFDLRRWKLAETRLNEPLRGLRITRGETNDTAAGFTVDAQRKFDTKMYYAPIPYSEMQLNLSLVQNPGWR